LTLLCVTALQIAPASQQPAATSAAAAAAAADGDSSITAQAASPAAYITIEIREPRVVESHPMQQQPNSQSSPATIPNADNGSLLATAAEAQPSADVAAAAAGTGNTAGLQFLQPVAVDGSYTPDMPLPVTSVTNTGVSDSQTAADVATSSSTGGSRKLQQSTTVYVQDALVVYTKLAADAVGGVDTLLSLVQQNFARANLAYNDSKVPIQLSMLAFRQVRLCNLHSANPVSHMHAICRSYILITLPCTTTTVIQRPCQISY
jgi:hypothetical protein